MRAGLRFGIAVSAALAFAPVPALAQNAVDAAAPAPAAYPPAEAIGPRELENFSLNGVVTRPAQSAPARPTAPREEAAGPAARPSAPPQRLAQAEPAQVARAEEPARSQTVELPPPTPAAEGAASPSGNRLTLGSQPGLVPVVVTPDADIPLDEGPLLWPWLLGALLLALGSAAYAWRQHRQPAYAAGGGLAFSPGEPKPAQPMRPLPRTAPPTTPPAAQPPTKPAGVVATRLRPWLEIEFAPNRCSVTEDKAVIEFEVSVVNSGGAPAREVLVEACMFNAGPDQDQEIAAFFARPVGEGERYAAIQPLKKLPLASSVSLGREQLRAFQAGDRTVFVPLIGFNAHYRWSGGEGQTSASFLVGRETNGDRMGPFRLDLGPREFGKLGSRLHTVGVRK